MGWAILGMLKSRLTKFVHEKPWSTKIRYANYKHAIIVIYRYWVRKDCWQPNIGLHRYDRQYCEWRDRDRPWCCEQKDQGDMTLVVKSLDRPMKRRRWSSKLQFWLSNSGKETNPPTPRPPPNNSPPTPHQFIAADLLTWSMSALRHLIVWQIIL